MKKVMCGMLVLLLAATAALSGEKGEPPAESNLSLEMDEISAKEAAKIAPAGDMKYAITVYDDVTGKISVVDAQVIKQLDQIAGSLDFAKRPDREKFVRKCVELLGREQAMRGIILFQSNGKTAYRWPITKNAMSAYRLTDEERTILETHPEAFALKEVEVTTEKGPLRLTAGEDIALWQEKDGAVLGGEEIAVAWLIPKSSRPKFDEVLAKEKFLVFTVYTFAKNNVTMITLHIAPNDQFTKNAGVISIPTPERSLVKGEGTIYVRLADGALSSNILRVKVTYSK